MMKTEEQIEMPADEMIDQSIALIIANGMEQNPVFSPRSLSIRYLLAGIEDCVLLSSTVYFLIMMFLSILSVKGMPFIPFQFMLAPALYGGLMYLSMWKDTLNKTIEWKQTCRISYKHITFYRMILFGGTSVIVNTLYNFLIWQLTAKTVSFLWIFSFSSASLFLFGFISAILLNRNIRHGILFLALLWALAGTAMFLYEDIMTITAIVPVYVMLAILLGSITGMICQIRTYISSPMKGVL